ncbi:MAG: hypothetical protein ACOY82_03270 [Pseudomonadota bacterium]
MEKNHPSPRAYTRRLRILVHLALISVVLALSSIAIADDGGIRHGFIMRGQVIDTDRNSVVVCIGRRDGAEVGQILDVVRHKKSTRSSRANYPQYERTVVGSVRITEVFDDHYARAEVVQGTAKRSDIIELEMK